MKEAREEAAKNCKLVENQVAKLIEGLQRLGETAAKARTMLNCGSGAIDVPTACASIDLREGFASLDRRCARIEILVQLAADAEST